MSATTMTCLRIARLSIFVMILAIDSSALAQAGPRCAEGVPSIRLIDVPPPGGGPDQLEEISGEISGVNSTEARVVIFSLAGGLWYVQPFVSGPYTEINSTCGFKTDIHLGERYAALLVRSSFTPPATTSTLPAVGGEVLSVTESAARGEDKAGSNTPAMAWFSGLSWMLAGVLILLLLVAISKRADSFIAAIEAFLTKTFSAGEKALGSWLRNCAAWLRKSGEKAMVVRPNDDPEAGIQQGNTPLFVLLGLFCLATGGAAAYGDYVILNQSLSIFWPISETAWVIAANMVALKAMVGTSLHLFRGPRGKNIRVVSNTILVLLLVCEFAIAYSRVIEVESTKPRPTLIDSSELGSLMFSESDVPATDPRSSRSLTQPTASRRYDPEGDAGQKNYFSFYATLSGLIAVVLALSETIGIRAAVMFAGVALVWLPASVTLAPLALAYCVFRFLARSGIAGLIVVVLSVLLDIMSKLVNATGQVARAGVQAIRHAALFMRTLPAQLRDSYRDWLKGRRRHRSEMNILTLELTAKEMDAAAYRNQHDKLIRKWHAVVEEILDDLLTELKGSMSKVNERFAADVVQATPDSITRTTELVAERLSSALADVYLETGDALPAFDGYRLHQQPAQRDPARRR